MPVLSATPTDNAISSRLGDFASLTAALDYGATGVGGMNFYSARGELTEVITWAQMRADARVVAGRLLARGLQPGDRVAIVAETEADFSRTLMGCLYARLVPCPIPLPSAFGSRVVYGEQLRRIADVAGIKAAVAPSMFRDWIAESLSDRTLTFIGTLAELDNTASALPSGSEPDAEEIAYLQFSSGTTSFPKGVAVEHGAVMANIRGMAASGLGLRQGDRGTSWLPYYHDMGLVGGVMVPIACQMSADFLTTRDFILRPGIWLELISRNRGTVTYAPAFGYDLAARRARPGAGLDLSSWRIAGIGGDIIKVSTLRKFADTFAEYGFRSESFLPSYGMAEAALGLTFASLGSGARSDVVDVDRLRDEHIAVAPSSGARSRDFIICGKPLPDHEIEIRSRVDDEADGEVGKILPEGEVGQIFARGPSLMRGYIDNPEETARVLSSDHWLDTGDLGYMRNGELVVTGRVKDLIIINGRNIWPQDIEWAVESRVEGVKEGGVAAFQLHDEGDDKAEKGRVGLLVECRHRTDENREVLRAATYETVRKICGVDAKVSLCARGALPRTSSGKLSRSKARDMFLAGDLEA